MRLGFGKSEKESSPSDEDIQYVQNYPGANDEALAGDVGYDPNNVQCPAHTTERKLLARIDLHVIPFLVLLYWLAFLDRYVNVAKLHVRSRGLHTTESISPMLTFSVYRMIWALRAFSTTRPLSFSSSQ